MVGAGPGRAGLLLLWKRPARRPDVWSSRPRARLAACLPTCTCLMRAPPATGPEHLPAGAARHALVGHGPGVCLHGRHAVCVGVGRGRGGMQGRKGSSCLANRRQCPVLPTAVSLLHADAAPPSTPVAPQNNCGRVMRARSVPEQDDSKVVRVWCTPAGAILCCDAT